MYTHGHSNGEALQVTNIISGTLVLNNDISRSEHC